MYIDNMLYKVKMLKNMALVVWIKFKDLYNLDFLALREVYNEREFQDVLVVDYLRI